MYSYEYYMRYFFICVLGCTRVCVNLDGDGDGDGALRM